MEDITFLSDQRDPKRRRMLLAERDSEYYDTVGKTYLRDTRGGRMNSKSPENNNND